METTRLQPLAPSGWQNWDRAATFWCFQSIWQCNSQMVAVLSIPPFFWLFLFLLLSNSLEEVSWWKRPRIGPSLKNSHWSGFQSHKNALLFLLLMLLTGQQTPGAQLVQQIQLWVPGVSYTALVRKKFPVKKEQSCRIAVLFLLFFNPSPVLVHGYRQSSQWLRLFFHNAIFAKCPNSEFYGMCGKNTELVLLLFPTSACAQNITSQISSIEFRWRCKLDCNRHILYGIIRQKKR